MDGVFYGPWLMAVLMVLVSVITDSKPWLSGQALFWFAAGLFVPLIWDRVRFLVEKMRRSHGVAGLVHAMQPWKYQPGRRRVLFVLSVAASLATFWVEVSPWFGLAAIVPCGVLLFWHGLRYFLMVALLQSWALHFLMFCASSLVFYGIYSIFFMPSYKYQFGF